MRNVVFYMIVMLAVLPRFAIAQKDSLLKTTFVKTFPSLVTDFTTDNLGNIYLLNSTNQVKKINANGDSIAVFNDVRRYGKIYSIDATNPLKLLVYYRDFSTILVLDRLLNIRNTIDLRQQNILQAKAITSSYDSNIWLFDELENKLKKIDDNGRVLLETPDFRQIFSVPPSPSFIYDRDGIVYLYDSATSLNTFDYYGAKRNSYELKGLKDFQVIDKLTIVGRVESSVVMYKPATFQSYNFNVQLPLHEAAKIQFNNNRLFVLFKNGTLNFYELPSN